MEETTQKTMVELAAENKKCPKCFSANASSATHCLYCSERFNQAKIFTGQKHRKKISSKILIFGGGLLAAAGYVFRRKARRQERKADG